MVGKSELGNLVETPLGSISNSHDRLKRSDCLFPLLLLQVVFAPERNDSECLVNLTRHWILSRTVMEPKRRDEQLTVSWRKQRGAHLIRIPDRRLLTCRLQIGSAVYHGNVSFLPPVSQGAGTIEDITLHCEPSLPKIH